MAAPEWIEIFRDAYSAAELDARIAELKKEISVYSAQAVGQKNYQKDLKELKDQLSAAVRVKMQRAGKAGPRVTVTDHRQV